MPRWIIPSGVVAILISLAALGILLAANANRPDSGAPRQNDARVEQPENSSQPAPPRESSEDGRANQDEQPLQGGPASQGERTTERDSPVPPGPRNAVVRIGGGAAYHCSVGVIGEPETIEGRRPTSYEVEVTTGGTSLETVMAVCQKISSGTLEVSILYDDEVVAEDETDSRLGTVSVSWSPLEE